MSLYMTFFFGRRPLDKLAEFLVVITLALSGIALALTLIAAICWALNSRYLRNYLRALCTDQHGNRTRPNDAPSTHSMVSIYGGDLEGKSESSEGDVTIMSEGDSHVSSHIPTEQEQDLTSQ